LTRDRIVREAFALVDDEGLDALTMRALSARLGVEAMSLYHHIASKDDLLDAMVVEMYRPLEELPDEPVDWREWSLRFMDGFREIALAHPNLFEVLISRPVQTDGLLRVADTYYETLLAAGLTPREAYEAEEALSAYALGALVVEIRFRGLDLQEEVLAASGSYTPERYPMVARVAPYLGADWDAQFDAGLALVLAGIEAKVHRARLRKARRRRRASRR
jgi:AcrR family transcriptional regulator